MTVTCPEAERHAIISVPKYVIRWTSFTPTSADQATWNQPVGLIGSGVLAISALPRNTAQTAVKRTVTASRTE
ncbi:hypothetical protein GCM10007298_35990 [Williamsia phyllosphaerae]|uniref:Uncharacterized protein n=1 Tax=Williamsia phyllosphaerae TaxID=885042 RepID=A0ABQ1V3E7_9NOCA|nr:hypothetical protein GCM10007298_35990 [Williamsia phyllosphaerae]